ncbi:DUF1059 domain-containing protein [Teredinibacter turnerae]|uniref:DUF1059 domain-containing protein n=1 Tax=Teredinibacter turnerae TaxID=2426 RepID=UPI001E4F559E|nr:DUF1059 domain-containing protein [Teredinibacter turnerae]
MKCSDLGGACDLEFKGDTFEEIEAQSKRHGMEMMQQKDTAHLKAMEAMRDLMKSPEDMAAWYQGKKAEFEAL